MDLMVDSGMLFLDFGTELKMLILLLTFWAFGALKIETRHSAHTNFGFRIDPQPLEALMNQFSATNKCFGPPRPPSGF